MKIKISSIPPRGLSYEEQLDPADLNARLNEGKENDIVVQSAPQVVATFTRTASGADFSGSVSATVAQPCARCGEQLSHDVSTKICYTLQPKKEGEEAEEDIGISYFEDDHFDSTNLSQESLILALSPFWKPDLDKNEFCIQCGKNCQQQPQAEQTEKKQTLGELFKKAGVN